MTTIFPLRAWLALRIVCTVILSSCTVSVTLAQTSSFKVTTSKRATGQKQYELHDQLSSPVAIVSDAKVATTNGASIVGCTPRVNGWQTNNAFGSAQPGTLQDAGYRYSFNAAERDDELAGAHNSMNFGARQYDSRVGLFLSNDPRATEFPSQSPYCFASNRPIAFIDYNGEGPVFIVASLSETRSILRTLNELPCLDNLGKMAAHEKLFQILAYGSSNEYVNDNQQIDRTNYARGKVANSNMPNLDVPYGQSIVFAGIDPNTPDGQVTFIGVTEKEDKSWEFSEIGSVYNPMATFISQEYEGKPDWYIRQINWWSPVKDRVDAHIEELKADLHRRRENIRHMEAAMAIDSQFRYEPGSGAAQLGTSILVTSMEFEARKVEDELNAWETTRDRFQKHFKSNAPEAHTPGGQERSQPGISTEVPE